MKSEVEEVEEEVTEEEVVLHQKEEAHPPAVITQIIYSYSNETLSQLVTSNS